MSWSPEGLVELLEVLPPVIREKLEVHPDLKSLVEVVLDYGRPAECRFLRSVERWPQTVVTEHDIDFTVKAIGEFGEDNRAGIERTLHRISAIRNRHNRVIGLTCRVGRALAGTIDIIDDIVRGGHSILLLGKPGVGKTTKLREVARVLADEVNKRVVIVDTSNEIGGDGDIPHPAIGSSRRMQVASPSRQHGVMIEAVENHMPEVIVIDEIGNEQEAMASRTIAERGVQLIATAHGQTLENLMLNPSLCDLIGGIQAVTLSDDEARRRGTQKTVLERKAPPTFDVVIELLDFDRLAVHNNVMKTVDLMLRGITPRPEVRVRNDAGGVEVVQKELVADLHEPGFNERFPSLAPREKEPVAPAKPSESRRQDRFEGRERAERDAGTNGHADRARPEKPAKVFRIFPFGIARTRLERAIRERKAPAYITSDIHQADAVIAISTNATKSKLKESGKDVVTVVVRSNTFSQIANALEEIIKGNANSADRQQAAIAEVHQAIDVVLQTGKPLELAPADARVRKIQHQVVEGKRLASESVGQDPERRLRILPVKLA